jgi:hypothetical protein
VRSDINYRLDALQRSQAEVLERLTEANPKTP